ncbi:MAG: hypothetical protein LBD98_03240 [Endomicrobium sp.]|jgi:hypothetical protein|nr:hypothetical protein [Endomicrobium sp.]
MTEITLFSGKLLDEEKEKISGEIKRLSLLQNKAVKDAAATSLASELLKRGYCSQQVSKAINSLADQDMPRISLGAILDEIRALPREGFANLCLRCGDIDHNGDYIASGYLPVLEIYDNKTWREARIACNCQKGKLIASKFGITLWNGKARMYSKKKKACLRVFDKHLDTYPMDFFDAVAAVERERATL